MLDVMSMYVKNVTIAPQSPLTLIAITDVFAELFRKNARNAGRSGENAGMREISQNAGFPARLRDG